MNIFMIMWAMIKKCNEVESWFSLTHPDFECTRIRNITRGRERKLSFLGRDRRKSFCYYNSTCLLPLSLRSPFLSLPSFSSLSLSLSFYTPQAECTPTHYIARQSLWRNFGFLDNIVNGERTSTCLVKTLGREGRTRQTSTIPFSLLYRVPCPIS